MALETFLLSYRTDDNKEIFITIKYDENGPLSPNQRLQRGGFTETSAPCMVTFTRQEIMPRYIDFLQSGGGFGADRRMRVFYRTHQKWLQDRSNLGLQPISAVGEKLNCKILNFIN